MIVSHPNPRLDAIRQVGGALLAALMALSGALLILAGVAEPRLFLLIFAGIAVWALIAPILMLSAASPAIEITDAALIVRARVWGRHAVPWSAIRTIIDHPLLPKEDGEKVRRAVVGRTRYQPERGKLIVAPPLPLPFRMLGKFAGVGFTGAIAVTSRTHRGYDRAIAEIEARWKAAQPALQSTPDSAISE